MKIYEILLLLYIYFNLIDSKTERVLTFLLNII